MARRPSINPRCVADRYAGPGERIAEFSTPSGRGGLIRVQEMSDGTVRVEVYRCDEGITVVGPAPKASHESMADQFFGRAGPHSSAFEDEVARMMKKSGYTREAAVYELTTRKS